MKESCFYQNVPCVIVKNRNFLKNKKLDDCGIILILRKWLEWIGFNKIFMNKELIEDKLLSNNKPIQRKKDYIYKVLFNSLKQNTSILW